MNDYPIVVGDFAGSYGVWFDDGTVSAIEVFLYQRKNRFIKIDLMNDWNYDEKVLMKMINAF